MKPAEKEEGEGGDREREREGGEEGEREEGKGGGRRGERGGEREKEELLYLHFLLSLYIGRFFKLSFLSTVL